VTPPSDEQVQAMEAYLGRVQALVIEQDWLSPEELGEVWHLIDHDEAPEGLAMLAWIIANHRQRVPASVVADIRRYTEGIVDPSDLPQDLDSYAG
jgi:hypothetical protein